MRTALITRAGLLKVLASAAFAAILGIAPAAAQGVPNDISQEVLIKSTLLTFNDANVTGNFTVLHAKLSKPFREQFSPEKLKQAFKAFQDNHIDFAIIAAKKPIMKEPAKIDGRGILTLNGHFDTTPRQVHFELGFIRSDGDWRPIRINVQIKKPNE
jgi:hypothetical protein